MLIPPSRNSPGSLDTERPARAFDSTRTVVLVGLMGAGKTTVGRQLAERLGRAFVDADDEIETAAGRTIGDIFSIHGESAFRAVEKRVIARLLDRPAHVLAAGGGAFMDDDTRALIADKAVSVWLRAGLEVLHGRVARRTHRPLLNTTDPRETLAKLMDQRYPIYAEADIIVDSVDGPHHTIVDQILDALGNPEKSRDGAPR